MNKQQFMDKYQGPYETLCVNGLDDYDNPLEELEFVYFDGCYLETYPMCIDVIVPKDKVDEATRHAESKGFEVSTMS